MTSVVLHIVFACRDTAVEVRGGWALGTCQCLSGGKRGRRK